MARNIIQDVLISKNKVKKPVIVTGVNKKTPSSHHTEPKVSIRELKRETEHLSLKGFGENGFSGGIKRGLAWWKKPVFLWGAGALLVIAFIYAAGSFFSGASIEITEKTVKFPINASFTSSKGASAIIPFEIILVKGSESKSVPATGSKFTEKKASGRIVVYNNYSKSAQKLVKNTRFESSSGKIYRIQNDISVPGISQKNGEDVPGSLEVTVFADLAGPSYNTGLTDFTIPGFKGDPRYQKFYARSKTEISGGFSGTAPFASDKDMADSQVSIEASLKDDLLREASSQVPEGYILYKNAVQLTFDGIKNISSDPKTVTLREDGALVGVLLKKDPLVAEIVKYISSSSEDSAPFVPESVDTLAFSFKNSSLRIDANTKEISFSLAGSIPITYTIDKASLINALAGKPKRDFQTVLSAYPSIYKARIISIKPFWARALPEKAGNISITVAK